MIGSRIAVLSGKSLDPDAKAFAAASGATDVAALSAFAKGIKDLGLWSSMVCWPLRSSQNAGTGTTVFSFGGLGSYNGTLVNGEAWGADGVTFTAASNQVMTQGLTWGSSESTSIFIAVITPTAQAVKIISGSASAPRFGVFFTATGTATIYTQGSGYAQAVSAANAVAAGSPSWIAGVTTSQAYRAGQINGGTVFENTSGSGVTTYNVAVNWMAENTTGTVAATNGVLAFSAMLKAGTLDNVETLRALYKSTLGQGIALP